MDEDFIKKLQAMVNAAEAVYYDAREKDREGAMWGGFEDDCPFTDDEMLKFAKTWGAASTALNAVFAVCEAAGVPVTSPKTVAITSTKKAEDEANEREFAQQNKTELTKLNSDQDDFRTDAERDAGIPKRGYF